MPLIQSLRVDKHLKQAPPTEVTLNDKGETVPTPEFSKWKDNDLLLRCWISGTLSEDALYYIVGCNIAKEILAVLEENLLQATKDCEVQLKQKLGTQPLSDYLKKFKTILDGLAAIQKPVPEDYKVIYMSRGLRKEYVVTSMLAKPPFPSITMWLFLEVVVEGMVEAME